MYQVRYRGRVRSGKRNQPSQQHVKLVKQNTITLIPSCAYTYKYMKKEGANKFLTQETRRTII